MVIESPNQYKTQRANSFSALSSLYDEVRPDYPEILIDDIIALSDIKPLGRILEIGIGTGKATKPFAERRFMLTGIDVSEEQITIAKKNLTAFPNITYLISSFEKAELSSDYDLVIAAQSFHFIDPEIAFKKVHECLKKEGYLAIFSNFQARNELDRQLRRIYAKHCPAFPGEEYGTLNKIQGRFESSGLFMPIEMRKYLRGMEYSKPRFLGLIQSTSWVSILPEETKSRLFNDLEKILTEEQYVIPIESVLLIAKKKME
jgi:SAM-dependent methyltransferase